jgi:hypothetical protein
VKDDVKITEEFGDCTLVHSYKVKSERVAHLKRAIAMGAVSLLMIALLVGYCQLCEIFGPIVALIGGVALFCWACWKFTERSR